MRIKLALVAAFALPLSALAQPAADSGKSTEVSELTVQARKATAVSDLTVRGYCPIPLVDSSWPHTMFDAQSDTKNKRTEESAGTREFVLREIAALRNNTRDYAHMGVLLARAARQQLVGTKPWIVCRGVFKDIKFLHVTETGDDDFEVDFSNGALEWEVKPLDSHQVTEQSAIRFFYPQPATKHFQALLESMERGRPNYADLTPDLAATVRTQWPEFQNSFKDWGGLGSLLFVSYGDDGSYLYVVGFRHREVVWQIAPLDANGKLTGLKYAEAPRG